ncbi:outer membrane lipoprotein chaperone LolA [Stenoxybacter acetivorans]|uniref:outer membrane lipoprotein chaperone LolA n=1 Tax=Stenoxybacter acetivorans TaxID=422441 RepID=UPI000B0F8C27|nr:outer membrane lipoprotein chaperone LolA [Stenoxybacter acetivorans]
MALLLLAVSFSANTVIAGGIDDLQKFNADVSSISGQFTQTVSGKKRTQTTSGEFQIVRPGLFRWEYNKPYQQLIVGDGKTVWLYDQDLAQVSKRAQNESLGDSPAAILSDKNALNSRYTLTEDGSNNDVSYVRAAPKSSNSNYQYIRIGFQAGKLTQLQLKDQFGNQTVIHFKNIQENTAIARERFRFTPPKGVDIISQ